MGASNRWKKVKNIWNEDSISTEGYADIGGMESNFFGSLTQSISAMRMRNKMIIMLATEFECIVAEGREGQSFSGHHSFAIDCYRRNRMNLVRVLRFGQKDGCRISMVVIRLSP